MTSSQILNVPFVPDVAVWPNLEALGPQQPEKIRACDLLPIDTSNSEWTMFSTPATEPAGNLVQFPQQIFISFLTVDQVIRQKLGDRAANRFLELKRVRPGWRFGEGESLSTSAELNFGALVRRMSHPPEDAKLFLLDDGAIQMQWKKTPDSRFNVICSDEDFLLLRKGSVAERRFLKGDIAALITVIGRETVYVEMVYRASKLLHGALYGVQRARNRVAEILKSFKPKSPTPGR